MEGPQDPRSTGDDLATVLRASAMQALEAAGGGRALVFVRPEIGAGLQLRTAAGFATPEEARAAAEALLPRMSAFATDGEQTHTEDPVAELGSAGAGGLVLAPLTVQGRHHGVLVLGVPQAPDAPRLGDVTAASSRAAYRLDHEHLCRELERLAGTAHNSEQTAEDKSDEILKLSEQLFAQDIQLLQNNEKLGKIEKLKNDFIEKMSRELRTPLNSIIEAIISVLAGENDALSEGAKQSMRLALDEGTAFLRTLQNILDLWRIKQGELPVEIQEVNFREVVDEAIFSVQDTLGDKPVAIQKEFIEPFPKLRTDLAKINQILFLALDNAAKFTERGSIQIRSSVQDGNLVCELEDTGIGICPDDQQFVFDEFYQVDELNSSRYRGSGLGLALVRDLLVLMDGTISLNSDVGRGSTFRFSIPVQIIG